MAQVTIYLPDPLEKAVRTSCKKAGKSLSSYFADLARAKLEPSRWPKEFAELFGSWEGVLERPADPPPEEDDDL